MAEILILAAQAVLALGGLLVLARALRGPSAFDRLFAIETFTLVIVGWLLIDSRSSGSDYLDGALVLALVGFVGTVFLARQLWQEKLGKEDPGE